MPQTFIVKFCHCPRNENYLTSKKGKLWYNILFVGLTRGTTIELYCWWETAEGACASWSSPQPPPTSLDSSLVSMTTTEYRFPNYSTTSTMELRSPTYQRWVIWWINLDRQVYIVGIRKWMKRVSKKASAFYTILNYHPKFNMDENFIYTYQSCSTPKMYIQ